MRLILPRRGPAAGAVALALTLASAAPCGTADDAIWRPLAPGLELARFEIRAAVIQVLRVDPGLWETVALAATDVGGGRRTTAQWGREFHLTAVINAGMYAADKRTHVGFFRTGQHVNNRVWIGRDYRQAACFEARHEGLPRFALIDLDDDHDADLFDRYEIVIQNLRLIRKTSENRWAPTTKRWPEACLGEDAGGRMLWIHCRRPLDMHTFNELLLELPLDLVAAQHLEGGLEAQLWIDFPGLDAATDSGHGEYNIYDTNGLYMPIPNVLGLRPRPAD